MNIALPRPTLILILALPFVAFAAWVFLPPASDTAATAAPQGEAQGLQVTTTELTGSTMTLSLRTPGGSSREFPFNKNADGSWGYTGTVGDVFGGALLGRSKLKFATSAALETLGLTPDQALRGLSPEIVGRGYEDITVLRSFSNEIGVCLWNKGFITEIWFSGGLIEAALAEPPDNSSACVRLMPLCCNTVIGEAAAVIPMPRLDACAAIAEHCPNQKNAACQCLLTACLDCDHPPCGDAERAERAIQACLTSLRVCSASTPTLPDTVPEWVELILQLLREILERLQRIIDLSPAPDQP